MNTYYSWRSNKTEYGTFRAVVTKNVTRETPNESGRYVDSIEVKEFVRSSRAIATRLAKQWKMYLTKKA